jgi:hypothetical protein
MPGKMTRSAPHAPFGLPEALVAVHTPCPSCRKPEKTRIFTVVRESSGESQLISLLQRGGDSEQTVIECVAGLRRALRNPHAGSHVE